MPRHPGRPRVVCDCNVLVQAAARSTGPSAAILDWMDAGTITVFVSRAVLRELSAVLEYPLVRRKNPLLDDERSTAFVRRLEFRGERVRRVKHVFDYARAQQDEPYIDLSAAAHADYLVSWDADLLSLTRGHSSESKRFRKLLPHIAVLTPPELLADIKARLGVE